jgi:hypothetical protein
MPLVIHFKRSEVDAKGLGIARVLLTWETGSPSSSPYMHSNGMARLLCSVTMSLVHRNLIS